MLSRHLFVCFFLFYLTIYCYINNMKTIYITESQKNKINDLLLENEGTNMKRARKYLESKGYSPEQRQQILDSIRTDIYNSRLQQCKFLLGVTRLYMEGQLNNGNAIANLNKVLKYVASDAHVNEYDFNLNGENLDTLVQRFAGVAKDDLQQSMAASNARQLTVNNNYIIVPIDNPKEAYKYRKYTSWCVTHDKNMYNSYTNNGSGRFYFCLRKGFENEPKVEGDGCPLDSYGLSMIAVSVTMEGEVNTITCRWNHDNGGNDNIMTIEQLEDVIGRNFYQTFKPYTHEELHAKGVILFDEVQDLLDSGKNPEKIFNVCGFFHEGFASVKLNNKYNFINRESKLLSSQWFDECNDFKEGFASVKLNNKWNFINVEGKLLSSQWFDWCNDFHEGFASVKLNNKYNFINGEGRLLLSQWFDWCNDFHEGFAAVYLNNKWNFINVEGKLLSSQWFDGCNDFHKGFAVVVLNDNFFNIDRDGRLYDEHGSPVSESKKNRKTIYITESQKKHIRKAIAAQDQVGGKVNAGVMDSVVGMCENIQKWYRGFDSKFGIKSKYTPYLLWLTDDLEYAKEYGDSVMEFDIDFSKCNGSVYDLPEDIDYYDGPDRQTAKELLKQGINSYCFYANQDSSYCMCLWDKSPIVSSNIIKIDNSLFENIEDDKYELGAEKGDISPYYHVNESNEETITLYHGVNRKGLEYNLEQGYFVPRVCSEGGPKAIWLSEKQYNYEFTFAFDIPKSEVEQLSNVDYIFTNKISFNEFNCRLVKTSIISYLDDIVIETNILNDKLSKLQFRYIPDLGITMWKEFKQYPNILEKFINPYIEKYQQLSESIDINKENRMVDINQVINSPEFKAWFGDSKVVDKNGNPLIVHHGSPKFEGDKFNKGKIGKSINQGEEGVFCTTQDMSWAKRFSYPASPGTYSFTVKIDDTKPGDILSGFLKLEHPLDFFNLSDNDIQNMFKMNIKYDEFGKAWVKKIGKKEYYKKFYKEVKQLLNIGNHNLIKSYIHRNLGKALKEFGYDGYIALMKKGDSAIEYCFIEPNQFKSIYSLAFNPNSDSIYESRKKVIKNDEGEIVPEKCDKCGGKVTLQIHGEPVYLCKDCGKYFGTMPFHLKENRLNENSNDRKINNYIKQKFGLTDFQDIRNKVMEVYKVIPYARIFSGRYLLGIFRLLFEDNIPRTDYSILNKVLYVINHNWFNIGQHLDKNFNGLSFNDLIKFVNLDVTLQPKLNYIEKTRKVKNGYTITHVDSFEEMDVLCDGEWCISHDEYTWDDIVSNETVYLVQNEQMIEKFDIDYEQNKEKWDETFESIDYMDGSEMGSFEYGGTPYDLYGLSRFVVIVSDWGISSCYSRYNIPNCLDGDFLNEKQLGELLGVNPKEAFPYIKTEEINENIELEDKWNGEGEKLEPLKKIKKIPPVLYHASYKKNRESILKNGIYASVGFEYSNWWCYNGPNGEIPDDDELEYLVFLSTKPTTWSDNFYLDTMDIYEIDTKQLDKNCFYLDPDKHMALKGSLCYTGNIPPSAIKLYDSVYHGKSVNENVELEISPENVDLSSFNIKKKLNPKFWIDEHLDSRIRLKLLDISDDFIEYLGIDPNIVKDIIVTGSLANFNWNEEYSDIDLHVLLDYSDVDENIEFVKQYFMAQKNLWNEEHKDLKIFGFPIEVYVQDINEKHDSSGVYSLDRDKWLREPDRDVLASSKVNKEFIRNKVSEYTNKIDKLVYLYKKSKGDEYKLGKIAEIANKLWDEIKNSRKHGFELSDGKEINNENVIFKYLRRNKFLDKLYDLKTKTYDKLNSLP